MFYIYHLIHPSYEVGTRIVIFYDGEGFPNVSLGARKELSWVLRATPKGRSTDRELLEATFDKQQAQSLTTRVQGKNRNLNKLSLYGGSKPEAWT